MDINIFDLSNYKVPYFYERKFFSFAYNVEEWKGEMYNFGKRSNFPMEYVPWGEKRDSNKFKKFKSKSDEFFTEEELATVPMQLYFTYNYDNIIDDKIIKFCWEEFASQINFIRVKSKLVGKVNYFGCLLDFSKNQFQSKIISEIPEYGFAKNSILLIKEIHRNFLDKKKFPVFISPININPKLFASFCEILINYEYFSNSPIDVILGCKNNNICKTGSEPQTVEQLSDHILKDLNFSKNKYKVNIFIDRCDKASWNANQTIFDDKSYYIRDIKVFEKKDNYYEDLLNKISEYKKIYNLIIEYKPNINDLNFDECKLLLNQIIKL
jgi:hypothetical protein